MESMYASWWVLGALFCGLIFGIVVVIFSLQKYTFFFRCYTKKMFF